MKKMFAIGYLCASSLFFAFGAPLKDAANDTAVSYSASYDEFNVSASDVIVIDESAGLDSLQVQAIANAAFEAGVSLSGDKQIIPNVSNKVTGTLFGILVGFVFSFISKRRLRKAHERLLNRHEALINFTGTNTHKPD